MACSDDSKSLLIVQPSGEDVIEMDLAKASMLRHTWPLSPFLPFSISFFENSFWISTIIDEYDGRGRSFLLYQPENQLFREFTIITPVGRCLMHLFTPLLHRFGSALLAAGPSWTDAFLIANGAYSRLKLPRRLRLQALSCDELLPAGVITGPLSNQDLGTLFIVKERVHICRLNIRGQLLKIAQGSIPGSSGVHAFCMPSKNTVLLSSESGIIYLGVVRGNERAIHWEEFSRFR